METKLNTIGKTERETQNRIIPPYEIDIDFTYHFEEDGTFQVFVKINVNDVDKSLPGYKLKVEGAGIFQLIEDDLSDNEKNNLKFYSSVNIIIGFAPIFNGYPSESLMNRSFPLSMR
jgi:preprotein translocase subunit SecB